MDKVQGLRNSERCTPSSEPFIKGDSTMIFPPLIIITPVLSRNLKGLGKLMHALYRRPPVS
jgi:hypothetical protein